jgi:hypothetical protein
LVGLITIRALNYLLQGWESYAAIMLVGCIVKEATKQKSARME